MRAKGTRARVGTPPPHRGELWMPNATHKLQIQFFYKEVGDNATYESHRWEAAYQ